MGTTRWMARLALAALPLAALAVEADGGARPGAQNAPQVAAAPQAHPLLAQMQALDAERAAFSAAFDWGAPAQRPARQREFSQAMAGFDRRALELKAGWLRSEGRVEEAAALEARLARPETREPRAELAQERSAGASPAGQTGEAVR